jgi:hypothetical protein
MMMDPTLIYNYPFVHKEQFQAIFDGKKESDGYRSSKVRLDGFLNSDLLSICIVIIAEKDLNPGTAVPKNPLNFARILNPELLYNGIPLFRSDYVNYQLYNMHGSAGASFFENSVVSQGSTTGPYISSPTDAYLLHIDFSRLRSACVPEHMFNTFRVANQTLFLNFNTPRTEPYRLFACYHYNGMVSVQSGVTSVYFD